MEINLKEISKSADLPIKSFSNVSLNDAPEYLKTSEVFLDALILYCQARFLNFQ